MFEYVSSNSGYYGYSSLKIKKADFLSFFLPIGSLRWDRYDRTGLREMSNR